MAKGWFKLLAVFWLATAAVWLVRFSKSENDNVLLQEEKEQRKARGSLREGPAAAAPAPKKVAVRTEPPAPAEAATPPPATPPPPVERIVLSADELPMSDEDRAYVKKWGFNLRGLRCMVRPTDKKVVCFIQDLHGRAYCHEIVTPAFLTKADGQYSCQFDVPGGFCTAKCQEGNEEVKWSGWQTDYCQKNPADCPENKPNIPYDQFKTEAWEEDPYRKPKPCEKRGVSPYPKSFKDVTMGILTREIKDDHATIKAALESWAQGGLLEAVGQTILFINERDHSLDSVFEQYAKPPYNVQIMGDSGKNGIGRSYDWMIGNSTGKYFMFIEKDFVLVEPRPCWQEQLEVGIDLLASDKAHVVRQRSRFNPGRPLWALVMFVGKEETVLQRQPDLLCYEYHWLEDPMKMWPKKEHFIKLHDNPPFWGSDSRYCGWTNNAHMIKTSFWIDNFRKYLPRLADGVWGLEGFMNSEDKAWHGANWIVGLGDGMFAHVDRNNFG